MKKPLSLNTQLTKLRTVNNLLKQTIPEAVCSINENGFKDMSRCEELKQVIYSLRDIQYALRGLKYNAHRSSQTRKMTIFEIRDYLRSIFQSKAEVYNFCGKRYKQNIEIAYLELASVEQFLQLKEAETAIAVNAQDNELF